MKAAGLNWSHLDKNGLPAGVPLGGQLVSQPDQLKSGQNYLKPSDRPA